MIDLSETRAALQEATFTFIPSGYRARVHIVSGGEIIDTLFPATAYEAAGIVGRFPNHRILFDCELAPGDALEYELAGWVVPAFSFGIAFEVTGRFPSVPFGAIRAASLYVAESLWYGLPTIRVKRFETDSGITVAGFDPKLIGLDRDVAGVLSNRIKRVAQDSIRAASEETQSSVSVLDVPAFDLQAVLFSRREVASHAA